jgi:ribonucleoside-diphosphate reductase beta chain
VVFISQKNQGGYMKQKNSYYKQSVSPLEYVKNNLTGNMRSINWNVFNDDKDLEVWNRITQNFWLPEKIPVSNDIVSWATLTPQWQALVTCSSQQIEEAHQWVVDNEALQQRAKELIPYYISDDPLESKIAAALMPGFLLYGGFYLPFYLSARGKLPNTSDIIRLILRDKVIHNYYSGYKFQRKVEKLNSEKQNQIKNFVFDLMYRLIDLEKKYLKELYAGFDIADDAIRFSTYNAGKFLQNLGYDSPFTEAETKIAPEIFNQLSARADENHDFFSGNGSSYVMGTYEETKDEDWDF